MKFMVAGVVGLLLLAICPVAVNYVEKNSNLSSKEGNILLIAQHNPCPNGKCQK